MYELSNRIKNHKKYSRVTEVLNQPIALSTGLEIPLIGWTPQLLSALQLAKGTRSLGFGLEEAEKVLARLSKRLPSSISETNTRRPVRWLLMISHGGSERFYRMATRLHRNYQPELATLMLDIEALELGQRLFSRPKNIHALFLNDTMATERFLLML